MTSLEEAIEKASAWLDIEGVESVSESEREGKPVVLVHLSRPEAARHIPSTWMGFAVVTQLTEPFQAQPHRGPREP